MTRLVLGLSAEREVDVKTSVSVQMRDNWGQMEGKTCRRWRYTGSQFLKRLTVAVAYSSDMNDINGSV